MQYCLFWFEHFLNIFITPNSCCVILYISLLWEIKLHMITDAICIESTSAFVSLLPSKDDFCLLKIRFCIKQLSVTFKLVVYFFTASILRVRKIETVWLSDLLKVIQEPSSFLKPCTTFNFCKLISFTLQSSLTANVL